MLIIARKINECITISHPAGDVVITVTGFDRYGMAAARVQLGVEAPPEITVLRTELGPPR